MIVAFRGREQGKAFPSVANYCTLLRSSWIEAQLVECKTAPIERTYCTA